MMVSWTWLPAANDTVVLVPLSAVVCVVFFDDDDDDDNFVVLDFFFFFLGLSPLKTKAPPFFPILFRVRNDNGTFYGLRNGVPV